MASNVSLRWVWEDLPGHGLDYLAKAAVGQGSATLSPKRVRQSTLSSLCVWLVKRGVLSGNPVAQLDRPPHRREAPTQVPGLAIIGRAHPGGQAAPTPT